MTGMFNACMAHEVAARDNFDAPTFEHNISNAKYSVVIQVDQDDLNTWRLALNNAQNILDYFNNGHVRIVVVTFGPGLKMLFMKSKVENIIEKENYEGVEFDACHHTLDGMTKVLGYKPKLLPIAVVVPSGVVRIVQLERSGFSYLRP